MKSILILLALASAAYADDVVILTASHRPVPGSSMIGVSVVVDVTNPELTLVDVLTTTNEAPTGLSEARSITCLCKTLGSGRSARYPACTAYVVEYGWSIEAVCMTGYPGVPARAGNWKVLR